MISQTQPNRGVGLYYLGWYLVACFDHCILQNHHIITRHRVCVYEREISSACVQWPSIIRSHGETIDSPRRKGMVSDEAQLSGFFFWKRGWIGILISFEAWTPTVHVSCYEFAKRPLTDLVRWLQEHSSVGANFRPRLKKISLASQRSQGSGDFFGRETESRFLLMIYRGAVIPPRVKLSCYEFRIQAISLRVQGLDHWFLINFEFYNYIYVSLRMILLDASLLRHLSPET